MVSHLTYAFGTSTCKKFRDEIIFILQSLPGRKRTVLGGIKVKLNLENYDLWRISGMKTLMKYCLVWAWANADFDVEPQFIMDLITCKLQEEGDQRRASRQRRWGIFGYCYRFYIIWLYVKYNLTVFVQLYLTGTLIYQRCLLWKIRLVISIEIECSLYWYR